MRRLSKLSLHLALGLTTAGFMAAPVLAQDLGTYRPGQAYQSVPSPSADVCNSHCAGDAQCSAWNYVKVNPQAPGVCEFLSSASSPVSSAISISGENASKQSFARPVSQGGSNTVRVGTSARPAPAAPSVTRAPVRRVVREAVPQRINPQATNHNFARQPQQQQIDPRLQQQFHQQQVLRHQEQLRLQQQRQEQQRQGQQRQAATQQYPQQQFRPLLDAAGSASVNTGPVSQSIRQQTPQNVRDQLRQNQARQNFRDQGFQGQVQPNPQSAGQAFAAPSAATQNPNGRPQIGKPIGPVTPSISEQNARLQPRSSVNLPRSSASSPVTNQNAREAFARRQADLAAIASGNSVDPIQQSLYGSLNDDVKVRAQLKTLPSDPNAPIATAASRPVTAVQTQPLGAVSGVQLAGGPR